ncbi:ThuA domain-containing protein [Chryseolinea sp. T2]|uniref:ThuA domain-containing protein n=1 Tax=Chryseolinea sp. T2 TaxID=3129255 RepID=UPI00307753C7
MMTNPFLFIFFLLLSFFSSPAQSPRFKVAAFYSTKGEMDHVDFARDGLYFFDLIAAQQQFTFDATTDWTNLNDNYLANYDVVIWLNDFPQTDDQRKAFERFIGRGGAWLGCHVSAFNLPDSKWKWFNEFLGGAYFHSNNWPPLPAKVVVDDRSHPVTKRLPASYDSPTGEWYQWTPSPRENKDVKVLMSLSKESYPLGVKTIIKDGDTPVVWTNTRYKMLYMNMGHGNKIFSSQDQNNMITDGLLWLGGAERMEVKK